MFLTPLQTVIIIVVLAAGIMLTRFLPFVMFPEGKKRPEIITYLGKVLPAATMGLLIVYSLRNVSVLKMPYGLPELFSILFIVLIHKWKRNVLLSIGLGTVCYMILIRVM